jgi:hypothetical protein
MTEDYVELDSPGGAEQYISSVLKGGKTLALVASENLWVVGGFTRSCQRMLEVCPYRSPEDLATIVKHSRLMVVGAFDGVSYLRFRVEGSTE